MYDLPCFRTSSPNYGAAVDKSLPTCFQHKEIFQPQRNKLKCCPQTAFDNSLDRISSVFLLYGILQRMVSTCRVYQRGSGRTPSNAPQISMAKYTAGFPCHINPDFEDALFSLFVPGCCLSTERNVTVRLNLASLQNLFHLRMLSQASLLP